MKPRFLVLVLLASTFCNGLAQNTGVGITTPIGKLHLKGSANNSQLLVDGFTSQTNTSPLIRLRNNTGTDLLWIHSDDNFNVFMGRNAGRVNNGGTDANVFMGSDAGYSNTTGANNTAIGTEALYSNISASRNTAIGHRASYSQYNFASADNTAIGAHALYLNSIGENNVACGAHALRYTELGSSNIAIGYKAGFQYESSFANIFIGAEADAAVEDGQYMIAIGNLATTTASYQARFGNSATYSIGGYADWSVYSDGRFKSNVTENVPGLDFILKLRPVTYTLDVSSLSEYLNESRGHALHPSFLDAIDVKEQVVHSGFIAQDVEQAAVAAGYDFNGVDKPKNDNDLYGLRYATFVVPLVKAVQELLAEVEDLEHENLRLQELEVEFNELKRILNQ